MIVPGSDSPRGRYVRLAAQLRRYIGSGVLGGLLLGVYFWVIGPDTVRQTLLVLTPSRAISVIVLGVLATVLWGIGLAIIMTVVHHRLGLTKALGLYAAAGFLNSITPFGQLGGDPASAVIIKRAVNTDFETSLAAISAVNTLVHAASVLLGLIGLVYLSARGLVTTVGWLSIIGLVGVGGAVIVGGVLLWRYRTRYIDSLAAVLARLFRPVGRLPTVTPPSTVAVRTRLQRLITAVELLLAAPVRLGCVFLAGISGHLVVAATLWLALVTVGASPSFIMLLLILPVAKLGAVAPTPGGTGGTEAVLTALIVTSSSTSAATAGTAVLLYRASAFWVPALVGAVITAWYLLSPGQSSSTTTPPLRPQTAGAVIAVPGLGVAVGIHHLSVLGEPPHLLVHLARDLAVAVLVGLMILLAFRHVTRNRGS